MFSFCWLKQQQSSESSLIYRHVHKHSLIIAGNCASLGLLLQYLSLAVCSSSSYSIILFEKRVAFQKTDLLVVLLTWLSAVLDTNRLRFWDWVPSSSNLGSPRRTLCSSFLQNSRQATSLLIVLLQQQVSRIMRWGFITQNQLRVFKDEVQKLQLQNEDMLLLKTCPGPCVHSAMLTILLIIHWRIKTCYNTLELGLFGWFLVLGSV